MAVGEHKVAIALNQRQSLGGTRYLYIGEVKECGHEYPTGGFELENFGGTPAPTWELPEKVISAFFGVGVFTQYIPGTRKLKCYGGAAGEKGVGVQPSANANISAAFEAGAPVILIAD